MFSGEFCKVFKSTFFTEHLRATASVYIWYSISFCLDKVDLEEKLAKGCM